MSIINYEKLEKPIREVEAVLCEYNQEEQILILRQINKRIQKALQDQKIKDSLGNMNMKEIIRRVMRAERGD